jgi:hypothetical protein
MGLALSLTSNSVMASSTTALSMNEISRFFIKGLSSSSGFSFTFSNDTAATESGGTGGVDTMNAPAACVGDCVGWEDEFQSHAPYSVEFSYGDAQIINDNVLKGTGEASSIGEVVVTDGIAHAAGSNVMTSTLKLGDSSKLAFSFVADPLMQTSISDIELGSSAANMFFNISITDDSNNKVFSWSPDGTKGGIVGGIESSDPFDLNYGITGNTVYDPTARLFSAETDALSAGLYTLNIKMENQANGAAVVPLPAAIWLFGSGLLGLVAMARRKKAA